MATANIRINGSPTPVVFDINTTVNLSNLDNTGVTSWQWILMDKPAGSTAILTTPTASTSTFVADREGSYLIKLIINAGSDDDTAVGSVLSLLAGIRLPAAYERVEASTSRGWAESLNALLELYEEEIRLGHIINVVLGSTIPSGSPVRITGETTLANGDRLAVVGLALALGPTTLPPIGVTISSGSSGDIVGIRAYGALSEVNVNTVGGSVNGPVYVSNTGTLSLTPGTEFYIVGRILSVATLGKIFISLESSTALSLTSVGTVPNANAGTIASNVLSLQPANDIFPGVLTANSQLIGGHKTFMDDIEAANLSGVNTGDISLVAVGAVPNANGASLVGQVLNLQPADGTNPGVLTASAQTIGGAKTFSSTISASNLSGTNTGDVTLSAFGATPNANGASLAGQALTIQPADTTNPGGVSISAQSFAGKKTFTGGLDAGSQILTGVATPSGDSDAANKAYVDAVASGLDLKASVRVATASALPANTRTGNTLTADVVGALGLVDGISLIAGDRLLVKNESTGANNGIYYVVDAGGATPWSMTRATDADTSTKVTSGMFTFSAEGASNADKGWVLVTNDPIVLNTTALVFTQFSTYTALSMGTVGSSPNANAGTISLDVLTLQPADGTFPGVLTAGAQTIGGVKTFSSKIALSNLHQDSASNGYSILWNGTTWQSGQTKTLAGFPNRTDTTISFVDSTRTFTITPTGATFDIWLQNLRVIKTGVQSVVIPNTIGQHFIYFDSTGTLVSSTSVWDVSLDTIAPVATIYWSGTLGYVGDERHSYSRDRAMHAYLHATRGTAFESGLAGTFTDTTFSVAAGTIWDEDIRDDVSGPQTTCTIWYTNASSQMVYETGSVNAYKTVAGVLQWDNAGVLTDVSVSRYAVSWVYATNNAAAPIAVVLSQAEYTTLVLARAALQPSIPNLLVREWKLIYAVIHQRVAGPAVSVIESTDYRRVTTLPGATISSLPASSVTFVPTGNITSTNVQNAIGELDGLAVHIAGTETITGAKTFSLGITAPGVAAPAATSLGLTSPLGAGGSDVCVKAGTSLADASCDISAKILSVRTGIGGTESEKMYVNRNGALVVTGNIYSGSVGGVQAGIYGHGVGISSHSNKVWGGWGLTGASDVHCIIGASTTDASTPTTAKLLSIRTGITGTEVEKWSFTAGVLNCAAVYNTLAAAGTSICRMSAGGGIEPLINTYYGIYFGTANGGVGCNTAVKLTSEAADGASAVGCEIDTVNAWSNASARLVSLRTNNVEKAAIMADGRLNQSGTDSSGTPGAATINKPSGISAIASGATTVVITNSLVTTNTRIKSIVWYGDHGAARCWVERGIGSFTITLSSAATANTAFGWEISEII